MLKTSLLAAAAALTAGVAFADSASIKTTTENPNRDGAEAGGALAGAAAGAAVGGPVGAVAGAIIGGASGAAMTPPTETVTTYTVQNPTPSIIYEGDLRVGTVLPETVTVTPVPDSDYAYVYVDDQPVVVDPGTRTVVWVQTN